MTRSVDESAAQGTHALRSETRHSAGVRERPILFSGPMVRAILDGRKTQTRPVMKHPEYFGCPTGDCPHERQADCDEAMALLGPYGVPGDLLWVRETWAPLEAAGTPYIYRADADDDGTVPYLVHGSPMGGGVGNARPDRWRPSIHMPRWASRLTLRITDVRVERLNDISDVDAKAEGVVCTTCANVLSPKDGFPSYRSSYAVLWERLHGAGSWAADPWVWVLSFQIAQSPVAEGTEAVTPPGMKNHD